MLRRLVITVIVLCGVGDVLALTDEEIFREFRFNLISPGARARGMGGAFISLADDATAAQANPSGLSFIQRAEFFGELRLIDNGFESIRAEETLPTTGVETVLVTGTNSDDTFGLSFLSAVIPLGRWTVAFSLQDVLNIDNSTLSSFAFTSPDTPGVFLAEGGGTLNVEVRNANASFGYRVSDHFGIGGTLTYSTVDARAEVVNTIIDTQPDILNISPEPLLVPTLDLRTTIDDDDDDLAYSIGLIYQRPAKWGCGAVYRRAPRFEIEERIDPEQDIDGDGQLEGIDLFGTRDRLGTTFTNELNLPDSFGVGGHYRLRDQRLTLALNFEWIRYSNLVEGYVPGVNVLTHEDAVFEIDDSIDTRFGAEYILFNDKNWLPMMPLRGGLILESDTTITARSTGEGAFASPDAFGGRDDQLHLTLGVGFNFEHWKIDVAADFADTDNEFLISVIYRK